MNEYDAQQLDMLEPAYLARFNLRQAPFSPALDERFFYLDAERAQRVDLLHQLTQCDPLLLLIIGVRGSGKTSLLQYLVRHADPSWRVCQVDAHAMMAADQLLWRVSEGFHIGEPSRDPSVLQRMLYEHMGALHRGGIIPLLVVDNAHELPADALEALVHLAGTETTGGRRLMRAILFSEPQIETRLDAPDMQPLRERITHTLEMPSLSIEHTTEYLQHRLRAAGYDGESLFSLREVRRIHKNAGGLPGHINEQAHQILNRRIGAPGPDAGAAQLLAGRRLLLFGVAMVAVAVVLILHHRIATLWAPSGANREQTQASGSEKQLVLAVPPARSVSQPPSRLGADAPLQSPATASPSGPRSAATGSEGPATKGGNNGSRSGNDAAAMPASVGPGEAEPTESSTPVGAGSAVTTDGRPPSGASGQLSLTAIRPKTVIADTSPQTITLSGRGFAPDVKVTLAGLTQTIRLTPGQRTVESDSRLALHLAAGLRPGVWTVRVVDANTGQWASRSFRVVEHAHPTATHPAASQPGATHFAASNLKNAQLRDGAWVLAREPHHFTVQLLSTHSAAAIRKFVRKHHLHGEVAGFRTAIKGTAWYTLVRGDYRNRAAAVAAARRLPESLGAVKPWVRRFDDIQGAVHESTDAPHHAPSSKRRASLPAPAPDIPGATKQAAHRAPQGAHDEAWLWSQDPSAYTLQLLAAHDEDNIVRYIKTHDLRGRAVYFHTRHDGQDAYSLVYGVYPDLAHAKAAVKTLPRALRKADPWARSFASIQAELSPPDTRDNH